MKRGTPILLIGVLLGLPLAIASQRPLLAQESFIGAWDNVDPATGGLTRIIISVDTGEVEIRAWGSCQPTDCDWGTVPLYLIGSSIGDQTFERAFATWPHPDLTSHMMLHRDGPHLAVEIITIFTDESGRSNFGRLYLLRRSQS